MTGPGLRLRAAGWVGALAAAAALGAGAAFVAGPATADDVTSTSTPACPVYNPPDELVLAGGTPQTAKLDSGFASPFQVSLANSNGCPVTAAVAGSQVTFSAPSSGPSGTFAASGGPSVLVGVDADGSASAPAFSANDIPGGYTLTASSAYGSVSFSLVNTAAGIAATITPEAPLSQAAYLDAHFNRPLAVEVLDANGNPVGGVAVEFAFGSGGAGAGGEGAGAVAGASFDGGQADATEMTNAAGLATSPLFSANAVAGAYTASATTAGVTEPASFKLDNVAGRPPRVSLIGEPPRSAPVGARYSRPLEVEVIGASGAPLQGVSVTFALGAASAGTSGAGGASQAAGASFLDGSSTVTETTGPLGRATSPLFRADATAGTFTATASVTGLNNPLAISLDNLAGKPPRVELVGQARRTATVGGRYSDPLVVKVLDAAGKPLQGTTVTFTLGSAGAGAGAGAAGAAAGASFLGGSAEATETTSAAGLAISPRFSANSSAGSFTATAAVAGVTNPTSVSLDNLAAKPPAIGFLDARAARASVGSRYASPLEARVLSADGKPLEGATVTFSLGAASATGQAGAAGSAGASFVGGGSDVTETTDAAGRAVSPLFVANTVAGAFTATASVSGSSKVASLPLANLAGLPADLTAGAAADEQTVMGTPFPVRLAVTVTDTDKNPVAGALVTFAAPARGASGRFRSGGGRSRVVRVRTNADGVAVAPAFVANRTPGGYVVEASVAGVQPAAFALVDEPQAGPA